MPKDIIAPQKTAFLFKGGRRARLAQGGEFPTEFFYGYVQLAASGHDVTILESSDFGIGERIPRLWGLLSTLIYGLTGIQVYAVWRFTRQCALQTFNTYDSIIVSTTAFGVVLALLKALGLVRPQLIFIVMGALDFQANPLRRWVIVRLLQKIKIVTISKGELEHLRAVFSNTANIQYLPFGVDNTFWSPDARSKPPDDNTYVLSIGNDANRDYATLINAWKPEYPELKIVTSLSMPPRGDNVSVIRGNWNQQIMSDSDIRDLYRNALFVIVPIKVTTQPSGQSVCLQAMACGKAVILTDTPGLWDRDLMVADQSCILVPADSVENLTKTVGELLAESGRLETIGHNAKNVIDQQLNVQVMADRLSAILLTDVKTNGS